MEGRQTKSLRQTYLDAERLRHALDDSYEASSPEARANLTAAIKGYRAVLAQIERATLFSSNETVEDLTTASLPYMFTSFRLAELVQKTSTRTPRERITVLEEARGHYERFLHLLDSYEGVMFPDQARLLREYDEAPRMFSTLGPASGGDPARRREAKIAAFRAERELRDRVETLQAQVAGEQQRKRRRTEERRKQLEGEGDDGDGAGVEAGLEALDLDEDADDEKLREVSMAQLALSAHSSLQALESINREEEVLAQAPEPLAPMGASVEEDERRRGGSRNDTSSRITRVDMPLRRLQSALGGGGGPLLDRSGKPLQPFTIVGSRAEMTRAVFRPGHNLPTMSIDEYLEEERRRGGIIEGGGEASGRRPEPDEDNVEKADAETMKAREWDEFIEANPRGSGNTLNRG